MKRVALLILMAALTAVTLGILASPAHAGPGGQVPGPGLCDYPGIGQSTAVDVFGHGDAYICTFPIEENGSQWVCFDGSGGLYGGGFDGRSGAGLSGINLGGNHGDCHFRCLRLIDQPNLYTHPNEPWLWPESDFPNPVGSWKGHLTPKKCVPLVPVDPAAGPRDPPPPNYDASAAPPSEPLAPVTNPGTPNPLATDNPQKNNH